MKCFKLNIRENNKLRIGSVIFNAVKKSYPLGADGVSKLPKNLKFDLKNPYILEALPEGDIAKFSKYDGGDLKEVCNILDKAKKGFDSGELKALYKKAFPNIKVPNDVNTDAMIYLNELPVEIGSKFDAHGIAKISVTGHLAQLNKLLTDGINPARPFHTAPLVASAPRGVGAGIGTSGSAYRDGSFILVGDKGKLIEDSGIKHVIVNDAYYNIVNDLQRKFPDVNFVRADNAVEYFSKL